MRVLLVSTYELGHQPFGLASPAAWLAEAGAEVSCLDLAVESLDEDAIRAAVLIAVYLPMHTATRLASTVIPRIRTLNPAAHVCFYGLYAPLNEAFLRTELGGGTVLGGEFESGLVSLYKRLSANGSVALEPQSEPVISLISRTSACHGAKACRRYRVMHMWTWAKGGVERWATQRPAVAVNTCAVTARSSPSMAEGFASFHVEWSSRTLASK